MNLRLLLKNIVTEIAEKGNNMSEELEQLHILTTKADILETVKEDLHTFFSSLDHKDVSSVLNLCKEHDENLVLIARLLVYRKEAFIQNDADIWEKVFSYENELVQQESCRQASGSGF